jgi:drug/metabolite transporter (DMT)-like permease
VIWPVVSMQNNVMPLLVGLLAAALFGAATPASKVLLYSLSAFQLAGLLYLGAAIGILPLVFRADRGPAPWKLPRKTCFQLLGAIFFGGFLGPVLLLLGLGLASSASVALWLNLELVATVALGQVFFHDRLTKTSALAVGGTLSAAILLSVSEGPAGLYAGLLVFAACFCWGLDNHFTALIDRMSPSQTTFLKGLVAGPVNFAIGMYLNPFHTTLPVVSLALLVGAFTYGISIVLYIASAQQLGATRSQILFSSSPFFGVLLSALFLGESLSVLQALAMVLIAGSLAGLVFEEHGHEHSHSGVEHDHWHRSDDPHHDHGHASRICIGWHCHWHVHHPSVHAHAHRPDLHHRHGH